MRKAVGEPLRGQGRKKKKEPNTEVRRIPLFKGLSEEEKLQCHG